MSVYKLVWRVNSSRLFMRKRSFRRANTVCHYSSVNVCLLIILAHNCVKLRHLSSLKACLYTYVYTSAFYVSSYYLLICFALKVASWVVLAGDERSSCLLTLRTVLIDFSSDEPWCEKMTVLEFELILETSLWRIVWC